MTYIIKKLLLLEKDGLWGQEVEAGSPIPRLLQLFKKEIMVAQTRW